MVMPPVVGQTIPQQRQTSEEEEDYLLTEEKKIEICFSRFSLYNVKMNRSSFSFDTRCCYYFFYQCDSIEVINKERLFEIILLQMQRMLTR